MIKIENTSVCGWDAAIRGMRNPMNSWDNSDSVGYWNSDERRYQFEVGANDLALMRKLVNAGKDHRKFMRSIYVSADVVAPLYWWKQFDTYTVGVSKNSCSTMHKIAAKEFALEDFSHEHLTSANATNLLLQIVDELNENRKWFNMENDPIFRKNYWWNMIQLLPESYNQRRTIYLNYEVLRNIYHARKDHKLDEWHVFCDWIKTLQYHYLITSTTNE